MPDPLTRGDDPRGHGDGDVAAGTQEERASNLRVQINITVLMLAEEMGYAPEEIAAELVRSAAVLRHGQRGKDRQCPGPARFAECSNDACRRNGCQGGAARP